MAEFYCSQCKFLKTVDDSAIGKTGKCPKCGESSTIGPTVPLAEPVDVASAARPALAQTATRLHPAKLAMAVITVVWLGGCLAWFAASTISNYNSGYHFSYGITDGYSDPYSSSEWLSRGLFFAFLSTLLWCVPPYLLAMLVCGVAYFVTKK